MLKNEITVPMQMFLVSAHNRCTGAEEKITVPVTKQQLQATRIVGQSSKELIVRMCERQGYTVLEIGKPDRRSVTVSLERLLQNDGGGAE